MNTREPTQPQRLHLGRSPNPAGRDRVASESSAKRGLWRGVACYRWKTVGRVRAKPRSAEKPVASKDNYRFPIRATIAGAPSPSSRSAGPRRRRRFTARVIPLLGARRAPCPGPARVAHRPGRPAAYSLRASGRAAGRGGEKPNLDRSQNWGTAISSRQLTRCGVQSYLEKPVQ
jgi:hypothetical protein